MEENAMILLGQEYWRRAYVQADVSDTRVSNTDETL